MKKHVFLTGATGLLGRNLMESLLAEGYQVTALVREKSAMGGFRHPGLRLATGTLFSDFTPWLSNVDIVIHAAAETGQHHTTYAKYWQTNTNATIQLFHAARMCHVETFLFVSTANTLGYGSLDDPGTEQKAMRPPFSHSLYAQSKKEAEQYLFDNNTDLRIIVVHPGFILGPYARSKGSGQLVMMGLSRSILFVPPGGKNFVHVKDVCTVILKALEHGSNGDHYLAVNENLSYRDFFRKLNLITGQNQVLLPVPSRVLVIAGMLGDLLRSMGMQTAVSAVNMKILCTGNYYSNRKSVDTFGMSYLPVEKAISDTVQSLRNVGTDGNRPLIHKL